MIFRPRIGLLGICLSGCGLPGCGLPGRGLFRRGLSGRGLSGRGLSGRGLPGCGLPGCYDFIIDFSHISDLFVVHVEGIFFYILDLSRRGLLGRGLSWTWPLRGLVWAWPASAWPSLGVTSLGWAL